MTQAAPSHGPVPEAPMRTNDVGGKVADGLGWYVVNVADAEWRGDGRSAYCTFEGEPRFQQYGTNIHVLSPGTPNCMYHREYYEDESFFVLSGTCALLVEGEERHLRTGDFVCCPAGTAHVFVGTGTERCAIFMFGGRSQAPERATEHCCYPVEDVALRHSAGVEVEAMDPRVAYADEPEVVPIAEPWWTPAG